MDKANELHVAQLLYKASKTKDCHIINDLLESTSQVLLLQPDDYNCWHARKRALIHAHSSNKQCAASNSGTIMHLEVAERKVELNLTFLCLKQNPKSYASWNHRHWALSPLLSKNGRISKGSSALDIDWNNEIVLLKKLLAVDSRNCRFYYFIHS